MKEWFSFFSFLFLPFLPFFFFIMDGDLVGFQLQLSEQENCADGFVVVEGSP